MPDIIHLDKNVNGQKKVELLVTVDQMLLDDIAKILFWIEANNDTAAKKIDAGFHLDMFYKSQLNPNFNKPIDKK